ncbi:hydroxyacid dehydrogenase [Candidatus Dojkabacteria bacterium]|nr:hydroxyacid dehydrogenase [Candidatus Dojkabacteria bacterium]
MKIAFFEIQGWEEKFINEKLGDHQIRFFNETLSEKNIDEIKDFDIISIFIYSKINSSLLDKLPNLKAISTRSTGFDHIDIEEANKRKIYVFNVPVYGENTVAEHTFALILSLSRNVHKAYLRTTREDYRIEGLKGFDLKNKTLGVIGTGSIGLHVIKIAKGFGMKVIAYDHHPKDLFSEVLNYEYKEFDEVLANSDIVSLHIPYNKATHHLINLDNINKFKKGAILINTARGGIIETQALIKALDEGILSSIGLDVLEGEDLILEEKQLLYEQDNIKNMTQLVKDHILLSKENVVFTPHIAFYSQEALERIIYTTIDNIQSYINTVN